MTPLVLIVGFLGSGKTTFLKNVLPLLRQRGLRARVIINDYQNAKVDAEQLLPLAGEIRAITGDCVCCGSREELLAELEGCEHEPGRVVLVETNGTTDSEQLIESLSLEPGLGKYSLPMQVSVIDGQRWQKRYWHNALEREQARTASHVVVTRTDTIPAKRLEEVEKSLADHHVAGRRTTAEEFAAELEELSKELAGEEERSFGGCECCHGEHHHHEHGHEHEGHEHHEHGHHEHEHHEHGRHHFASFQIGLPEVVERGAFLALLKGLPETVIRAKGLVRFAGEGEFFIFQKVDRFDEPQFFPVEKPTLPGPVALFIGPELPEEELREKVEGLGRGA